MFREEIPRDRWGSALLELLRHHRGERVSIELMGTDLGAFTDPRELPLQGIIVGQETTALSLIDIITGAGDVQLHHEIHSPQHIWIARTDDGQEVGLQIDSESEPTTVLRFWES